MFNENDCKLSFEPNVCIPKPSAYHRYDYIDLTLTLDTTIILALSNLNGLHVYALDGLRFDETNSGGSNDIYAQVDLPCKRTFRSSTWSWTWSRWIKADINECLNPSVTIDEQTESALERSIYASNDINNPIMIDVYLLHSCHDDDAEKVGMNVYVSSEDQCYRHVHPQHM